jgi:uncharacterized membrane protein
MMTTSTHPLAADYLRRLERAAGVLPRHQRDELVAEIRDHLDAGITPDASEADVRNLLDDLGAPEAIVAEARPDGARRLPERGPREVFALLLLVTGLPMLIIGWFVGAALLLWSPLWTVRQKLLGLLIFPGGYFVTLGAAFVMPMATGSDTSEICTGSATDGPGVLECVDVTSGSSGTSLWPILLIVVLVVAPVVMATYLYRAAGRRAAIA